MQIELPTCSPGMSGQQAQRLELQVILQSGPRGIEQSLEDPSHGEDRWPAVDAHAINRVLIELAAGRRAGLEQGDLQPLAGQINGRGQAARACTHHHHMTITGGQGHGVDHEGSAVTACIRSAAWPFQLPSMS